MSKIIWLLFLKPMVVNDLKGGEYGGDQFTGSIYRTYSTHVRLFKFGGNVMPSHIEETTPAYVLPSMMRVRLSF